jgi:alpha-mannosidase
MSLTLEWLHRIQRWQEALWNSCYYPIGDVSFEGFTTFQHLTFDEASQGEFSPMPAGTPWGKRWEYGWFSGQVVLPETSAGKRVVLRAPQGVESLVWINGRVSGSYGWGHNEITLTRQAQPGQRFNILIEAYAGHPSTMAQGPVPFGIIKSTDPETPQVTVQESTYGLWMEDMYQLAVDFTTLFELRQGLDPRSLRVAEIDRALMDATLIVDVELPEEEMLASARQARARLKPLLDSRNGGSVPTFYTVGNAHIDVAWLWPLAETDRKIARTAVNQLVLIDEYPEYRYLQSTPELFERLKQHYPELYARFKAAVAAGNVIPEGAMWLEADTNITGGESLVRQVLLGRRYFQSEFGVDSRVLWLPDVFGYSGSLPQILRQCGCIGFATQKITWNYNGGEPFPFNTFNWVGIDGTSIPAHIFTDYTSHTRPKAVFERWNTRLEQNGPSSMILAFGWGDGGGGAERDHLEFLRRGADLEGLPRLRLASPAEFFADLEKEGLPKEYYTGELYFQGHRGTYTTQAKIKQGMRRCEFALREAELWGVAAHALRGYDFTPQTLSNTWHKVLLNQFHDILPGSCIQRVKEEAEADLASAYSSAMAAARNAAGVFIEEAGGYTAYNSLPWPRTELVYAGSAPVEITIPACGWTSAASAMTGKLIPHSTVKTVETGYVLENDLLRLQFNERGELTSMIDKASQRELMSAPGNQFRLFKDVPDFWDAWDIVSMYEQQPVTIDEPVRLEIAQSGPVVASLRMTRKLHASSLSQVIRLRRGSQRVEFATTVDWQESHKLLKVSFPFAVQADEVISEIQFGHLRRSTHRIHPFDADRFEINNQKWSALAEEDFGVALLNDCKYGLSALGSTLSLTLLRSPLAPDPTADRGLQTFTYALYAWNGPLHASGVVREAYELNTPVLVLPGSASERSLFRLDAPNVVIEAVKPAEDGSGDVVIRLYEAMRRPTRTTFSTSLPFRQAFQCDMLESTLQELEISQNQVHLDFRPFEIKTIILKNR